MLYWLELKVRLCMKQASLMKKTSKVQKKDILTFWYLEPAKWFCNQTRYYTLDKLMVIFLKFQMTETRDKNIFPYKSLFNLQLSINLYYKIVFHSTQVPSSFHSIRGIFWKLDLFLWAKVSACPLDMKHLPLFSVVWHEPAVSEVPRWGMTSYMNYKVAKL